LLNLTTSTTEQHHADFAPSRPGYGVAGAGSAPAFTANRLAADHRGKTVGGCCGNLCAGEGGVRYALSQQAEQPARKLDNQGNRSQHKNDKAERQNDVVRNVEEKPAGRQPYRSLLRSLLHPAARQHNNHIHKESPTNHKSASARQKFSLKGASTVATPAKQPATARMSRFQSIDVPGNRISLVLLWFFAGLEGVHKHDRKTSNANG
jgi:hypothetical protein